MSSSHRPKLAVFKFASCDGCQLTLLDCEDELLAIADAVEIAYFVEARSQMLDGPYEVTLVEGSITTDEEIQRIKEVTDHILSAISFMSILSCGAAPLIKGS